jgi:hypothetical protein
VPAAPAGNAFIWYDNTNAPAAEPILQSSATETTTYYIIQQNTATGCKSATAATWSYTVHELPAAPALSSATLCKNGAIPAVPAAPAGHTFVWYSGINLPAGGEPLLQNTTPGVTTYFVIQKDLATGCEGPTAIWTYTVHDLPAMPALSGATLCKDGAIPAVPAAPAGHTFVWYNGNNVETGHAPSLQNTTPGVTTYFVIQQDDVTGCKSATAATWTYTVYALPTAPALSGAFTCKNGVVPAVPVAPAGYIFLWYNAGNLPVNAPALQSSATETTTYYIIQQNTATGCKSATAATWIYTVHALPNVAISGAAYFCATRDTMLTASGAMTYLWNTGAKSAVIMASAAGTYRVTGTDHNGCSATAQTSIIEKPLPLVVANNDTVVCLDREVTLGTLKHVGALHWDSPQTVRVTGPRTYTVTATTECGAMSDEMAVDAFAPIRFIIPNRLPPYNYRKVYEQELSFENAERPVYLRWTGTLPDGMMITPDGILRGMPIVTGNNLNSHRFTLFLEDDHSCTATQEFTLPPHFHAPNAIIRDGGENSHFLPDLDLEIYNRQGILLHKGRGWHGNSGSSRVSPGTYFYKITIIQDGEPRQYMGYITVLQ